MVQHGLGNDDATNIQTTTLLPYFPRLASMMTRLCYKQLYICLAATVDTMLCYFHHDS